MASSSAAIAGWSASDTPAELCRSGAKMSAGNGIRVAGAKSHERARAERIGDEVVDRNLRIADPVDERRVRAVLEQPAHEVGQQVAMTADRRVDAARDVRDRAPPSRGRPVERVAHSVQALELEVGHAERCARALTQAIVCALCVANIG